METNKLKSFFYSKNIHIIIFFIVIIINSLFQKNHQEIVVYIDILLVLFSLGLFIFFKRYKSKNRILAVFFIILTIILSLFFLK